MAQDKWVIRWDYGLVGSDSSDVVSACDYLGITEEELSKMSDEEVEKKLVPMVWDEAVQQVDAWCRPARDGEESWDTIRDD